MNPAASNDLRESEARTLVRVQLWRQFAEIDPGSAGTSVAIGVFDGVHRGHRQLLEAAVAAAQRLGTKPVMITFDPHPVEVFRPAAKPAVLTPLERRAELAGELGIQAVFAIPFDTDIASWGPEEFVDRVLVERLAVRSVVVGGNFTFGRRAAGKAETLSELCAARGIECRVMDLLADEHGTVSSTNIRAAIDSTDLQAACAMLGRPHRVTGEVVHGLGRGGKELGYPTANLSDKVVEAIPGDGVYAGWFTIIDDGPDPGSMRTGTRYQTAISVGSNPTFDGQNRTVEAFVLDHSADLYGRQAAVEFVAHVRGMEKFSSVDELLVAMDRDVRRTREILEACDPDTGIPPEWTGD